MGGIYVSNWWVVLMEKYFVILPIDEFEDPMSLLYQDKSEWFDGKTAVYLLFDKRSAYYASNEPFTEDDIRGQIVV
jgi:hypothetical protein